jgi:hypothetical protein
VTAFALAFSPLACGEKFVSAQDEPASGSGGTSSAGKGGGGKAGSDGGRGGMTAGGSESGGVAGDVMGGSPPLAGKPPLGGAAGVGGGPVVVEPIPQEGLELWFRVDHGVMTEDDGAVAEWQDGSPHLRHALQTAVNYRPRLQAAALGDKPGILFDGEDDYLKLPTLDADLSSGLSIFLVMQKEGEDYCAGYFEASNASEVDDVHLGEWNNSLNFEVEQQYLNDTSFPLLHDLPQIAVAVQRPNQEVQVRSNSQGVGEGPINLPPQVMMRGEVFIGNTLYDCPTFRGRMGELLLYSRAVSDEELLEIESYLQQKWGCCSE